MERKTEPSANPPPDNVAGNPYLALIPLTLLGALWLFRQPLLFALFIATVCAIPVHLSGFVLSGWLFKVPVQRVDLFFGGAVVRFAIGNVAVRIGSIPVGGSVSLEGIGNEKELLHPQFKPTFGHLPRPARIFTFASGTVVLFAVATCLVGVPKAIHYATVSVSNLIGGALSPSGHAQTVLQDANQILATQGFVTFLAFVFVGFGVGNLMPIPPLNGGAILSDLLTVKDKPTPMAIFTLGTLLMLAFCVAWAVALGIYVVRS